MPVTPIQTSVKPHPAVQRMLNDDNASGRAGPIERLPLTEVLSHCSTKNSRYKLSVKVLQSKKIILSINQSINQSIFICIG